MAPFVPPRSRRAALAIERLGTETLVYDLARHRALCLNRSAALVWRLCNGRRSIAQIAGRVRKTLGRPIPHDVIWWTVDRLSRARLLTRRVHAPADVRGWTRRDLLRKLGMAGGVVLLPKILVVLAPTVAQAASGTTAAACWNNPTANAGKCCTDISPSRLCIKFGGIGICFGAQC